MFALQSRPETVCSAKDAALVATPKSKPFDHVFSLLGGGTAKKMKFTNEDVPEILQLRRRR